MDLPEEIYEVYLNGEIIDPVEHDPYAMEKFREMIGDEDDCDDMYESNSGCSGCGGDCDDYDDYDELDEE